ncbi:MAG: alpha-amylase family glycosyl hydrolase, partial [Candidatus Scalindua sp.]|nr:alpha-amylase family glycosyl hydrolase [Candidatus Scalindua sp.]
MTTILLVEDDKKGILSIYEINTRVWLRELSHKYQEEIRLGNITQEEITNIKKLGFDAVWLMGVWRSSERGREIALNHKELRGEFLNVLPDLKPEDIACSPYSIAGYEPDASLGGLRGLIAFKKALSLSGMKLILDFVPNHVALDHPWVDKKPEYFINGTTQELQDNPGSFFSTGDRAVIAHGKDPYFPAWTDVAQLNYFNPETRQAMLQELLKVASLCDGVRCDMAMLILKRIQKQIWGERVFAGNKFRGPKTAFWQDTIAEVKPFLKRIQKQTWGDKVFGSNKFSETKTEFWQDATVEVKKIYPDFFFIAEVYWGMESELASLGFDYVYDKSFYDALKETRVDGIRANLSDTSRLSNKHLRFIENHDENRAAKEFGDEKAKAAALIMALAPGAHLFHQGQLEGFKIKLPVQLTRRPEEIINRNINSFYKNLLSNIRIIMQDNSRWV